MIFTLVTMMEWYVYTATSITSVMYTALSDVWEVISAKSLSMVGTTFFKEGSPLFSGPS